MEAEDPLAVNYGEVPLNYVQSMNISGRKWTKIEDLTVKLKNKVVLIRGAAQVIRAVGKDMIFLVVRERFFTVQCVLTVTSDLVSSQMVRFANGLTRESIIDVEGIVADIGQCITDVSQQVEIQVRKLHCINRASALPFNIEDASRSEVEIEMALQGGTQLVRVDQDTKLNYRVIDLRTPANQAIFRIQDEIVEIIRNFLWSEDFSGICTPKLMDGSSEDISTVFIRSYYKGKHACMADTPQLQKQMFAYGDFSRVFEIGPVLRVDESFSRTHFREFTGLDVGMEIKEHYAEMMDVVDGLFVAMFDTLNETCSKELESINKQYPFRKLKYLRNTLRLTFEEGTQMLKEAGVEIEPLGYLDTESGRKLGQLILEKYQTEFYILHRYPSANRPFYTLPCSDNPNYSNSFDVFIRGEEIMSGAQCVHVPEFLTERAQACGIDSKTISKDIEFLRYESPPPHGVFSTELERLMMLVCALDDIRKTTLFP